MIHPRFLLIVSLILAGAATRLAPHWWNATAIGAICLFGGAYFRRTWLAFLVPLAAIALSDIPLQLFVYGPQGYGPNYFKYVAFAATVPIGMLLRDRVTIGRTAGAAVLAAAVFFLLSNFHVWLGGDGIDYPRNAAGLLACYIAALPFALSTVWGNLFYSAVLFGTMELAQRRWPSLAAETKLQPVLAK
jgi:hypothetical protein